MAEQTKKIFFEKILRGVLGMTADFLNRGKEYISMLESSKYMCERNGLDAHALKLPDVTEEDTERCKKHVTGHIRLMRKSTPEYYQAVAETLSANKAVLLYLYDNFDIFGRYGNKQLKDELSQKNIDTGMGLERLAVVCQGVNSLFDVDTVMNITHKVSEITGAHYGESNKRDVSLRVITDHIRSATFMICDGILPSNEGRGYVLRRLLRRAARHGKLLGGNETFLYKIIDTVIHENECQYPELREKQQ